MNQDSRNYNQWAGYESYQHHNRDLAALFQCFQLSLFPFKSLNGRWHVYKFFDDWTDVKEAKKVAKNIERELP